MKTYIGISRDHSASMSRIATFTARDYNSKVETIKESASLLKQNTIVSVVECGYGDTSRVRRVVVNSAVEALQPIGHYETRGSGTPLFDSVGDLIEQFESVPDANDPEVSFLVMAITDGAENASFKYNPRNLSKRLES